MSGYRDNAAAEVFDAELREDWARERGKRAADLSDVEARAFVAVHGRPPMPRRPLPAQPWPRHWRKGWGEAALDLLLGR